MYSCEFCKISKNTFFTEHLRWLLLTLTIHGTAGEGRRPSLFLSTTLTRSRTFRYLFATLHASWLLLIFYRTACNYHSSVQLPPAHHKHSDIYLQLCMWDDYQVFFNYTACNYQTATRWDLPPYWITICLMLKFGMLKFNWFYTFESRFWILSILDFVKAI